MQYQAYHKEDAALHWFFFHPGQQCLQSCAVLHMSMLQHFSLCHEADADIAFVYMWLWQQMQTCLLVVLLTDAPSSSLGGWGMSWYACHGMQRQAGIQTQGSFFRTEP